MFTIQADCNPNHRQIVVKEIQSYIEMILREYVFDWNKYNIRSYWRTLKSFAETNDIAPTLEKIYDSMSLENKNRTTYSEFREFMEN